MRRARVRTGVICVVRNCLSAYYTGCGIKFHPFPNDVKKRNKWLSAIKLSPDDYNEDMMICNMHFSNSDYISNNPKKGHLKMRALPHFSKNQEPPYSGDSVVDSLAIDKVLEKIKNVTSSSDLDSNDDFDEELDLSSSDNECTKKKEVKKKQKAIKPKPEAAKNKNKTKISTEKKVKDEIIEENDCESQNLYEDPEPAVPENVLTHVCRICLATGCKMYSMKEYNLEPTYLLLTGITSNMFDETKLPQMLCFECVQRLQNFIQFSTKSLTAWSLLVELIKENKLSMDKITSINREQNLLSSQLGFTIFEPNYYDFKIEECDEMENEEVSNIDHIHNDSIEHLDLDMNVDDEGETFRIEEKIEVHDITVFEQSNENTLPSENMYPSDKEESSDSEDDFFNSNVNPSENKYPSENAADDSEDDLLYNSKGKKKSRKRFIKDNKELFEVTLMTPEMQKAKLEKRKKTRTYQNAEFTCDKCYRAFNSEAPFKEHMKKHTNERGEFVCTVCQVHFFTRFLLNKHVRTTHHMYIQCRLCPFKTSSYSAASGHKLFHSGKQFQCKKCPKSFAKSTPFMSHLQLYHPDDAVCHLCGESHSGLRTLDQHLRAAHRGEDLKLPPTKRCRSLYELQSVRRKETSSKYTLVSFPTTLPVDAPSCDQCDIRFRDEAALGTHLSSSPCHGNPPKKCTTIRKYKRSKGIASVTCELCGVKCEGFRQYASHFLHVHPGSNRSQFSKEGRMCEQCGKIFLNTTFLNDHRMTHTDGGKGFACDICGIKRGTKTSLSLHMRDHRLSRKCKICGKVFASAAGLSKHLMIHTHKPYSCDLCEKRFCTPSEKKAHVTHSHMGVPWPKKRPKGSVPLRQRGGKFQSVADMMEIEIAPEQSGVRQDSEDE